MALTNYHQKYIELSDEEIGKRALEKKVELENIFNNVKLDTQDNIIRIAVMGCGDIRFIKYHRELFGEILEKPVEIFTYDIMIEHLRDEKNVFQHDCTLPLPSDPFDITYAHVLLRFIEKDKQWNVLKNSYDALKVGGLAIHVVDREDYETKNERLSNGLFTVPLLDYINKVEELKIKYYRIPVKYGTALVIQK